MSIEQQEIESIEDAVEIHYYNDDKSSGWYISKTGKRYEFVPWISNSFQNRNA